MDELQIADPYTMRQDTKRSVRMDIFPVPGGDVDKNLAAAQAVFARYHEELARGNSPVTKPTPGATIRAREPKFMCRRFLMGTLVELGDISATEALAKMSEFLCEKSAAQITKDGAQTGRASKHALVFVPVGGSRLQCTIRFKVYRTDCQSGGSSCLVLEITRRSGDAVAFGHVSIRVKNYLLQRPMSEIPAPPPLEAFLAKSGVNYPQDGMPGLLGMPDEVAVAVLATPM
jgi:hypothetical protein